jgi:hypothetical protein
MCPRIAKTYPENYQRVPMIRVKPTTKKYVKKAQSLVSPSQI